MTRKRQNIAARSLARFSFLAILALILYSLVLLLPVSSSSTLQGFEVEKGESVRSIAKSLKESDLIRSPFVFRTLVRLQGLTLQAGTYQLSPSSSPQKIAQTLTRGFSQDLKLTIPEGYRTEEIAEAAGLPVKEFLQAAKAVDNQLFPDTYFLKEGYTVTELVEILHANFLSKVGEISKEDLILASLVERETKGLAEKPIVAGILKKRLAADWPLELDATVQYALGKSGSWWPNTTLLDRKTRSTYNTYLNPGLPPSPICHPGLAAIQAAQNPTESPYWFYLHDDQGRVHYGATLEEHNQNIAKYIN